MTGDDAEVEPPRSFVEPFLARERAAREVLDELSADLLVGEAEAVRERLRELAETDHGTFLTCCLCCNGNDQFFADVAEQFDDDTADRLRELGETYEGLADEFRIVRDEVDMGRENPITRVGFSGSYREREQVPLIRYQLYSGEVELLASRESPDEVLQVASFLVGATSDTLENAVEHEDTVNTEELSDLLDRRDDLERRLGELEDILDELPAGGGVRAIRTRPASGGGGGLGLYVHLPHARPCLDDRILDGGDLVVHRFGVEPLLERHVRHHDDLVRTEVDGPEVHDPVDPLPVGDDPPEFDLVLLR
jgi:hypothetical protein